VSQSNPAKPADTNLQLRRHGHESTHQPVERRAIRLGRMSHEPVQFFGAHVAASGGSSAIMPAHIVEPRRRISNVVVGQQQARKRRSALSDPSIIVPESSLRCLSGGSPSYLKHLDAITPVASRESMARCITTFSILIEDGERPWRQLGHRAIPFPLWVNSTPVLGNFGSG
jgi:hypothetical protein